jgi:hypothetical protein
MSKFILALLAIVTMAIIATVLDYVVYGDTNE